MRAVNLGRAVLRAYKNVRELPPSTSTAIFDATARAGRAMDVALRIRLHGRLTYSQLQTFGELAGVPESELRLSVVPALERAGLLTASRGPDGSVIEVEEQIGVSANVLEQCAQLWEAASPADIERCAIESADIAATTPLAQSEHQQLLEQAGHPAVLHGRSFGVLRSIGLLRAERSRALGEDVLYSPYVWGTEAVKIAEFLSNLPPNERSVLAGISGSALERPGAPLEGFSASDSLIRGARKVGLIDATRVVTTTGTEKGFVFPPNLEQQVTAGSTEEMHERKLFVSHILYGHLYGHPATGKIETPLVLVRALIRNREVGPATAISTQYPLLEAHGVVRVRSTSGSRAYLELVKDDVARDALELLELALGSEQPRGPNPIDALWLPGSFQSPERDRHALPELRGAETELFTATLERLREETQRALRQENV